MERMERRRVLILAEGAFSVLDAKTAACVLRYRPDDVVGVIDPATAGRTTDEVLGFGPARPVVPDLVAGLDLDPDALLIGVAPRGGELPPAWRPVVRGALEAGLDVVSGLHEFLGDDPELVALAREKGVEIVDLRRPPPSLPVATRRADAVEATVVLTVGTDCNVGKMTAAMELALAARRAGYRAAFAPTGQTGLFIDGVGIAVDRVIADFVAGAAERIVLDNAPGNDFVFVEGQGALAHPGYSGVTLGLLHGSQPDAMVLVHQPTRVEMLHEGLPIPPLGEVVEAYERAAAWVKPAPVVAIAINGHGLDADAAAGWAERIAAETGLPAADPVRDGGERLVEAVVERVGARKGAVGSAG